MDIRTKEKAAFQETMDDLVETLKVPELDTLYNVTYLNAKGISFDEESADTEEDGDGFSLLAVARPSGRWTDSIGGGAGDL